MVSRTDCVGTGCAAAEEEEDATCDVADVVQPPDEIVVVDACELAAADDDDAAVDEASEEVVPEGADEVESVDPERAEVVGKADPLDVGGSTVVTGGKLDAVGDEVEVSAEDGKELVPEDIGVLVDAVEGVYSM
jgi:hypothetical protein